MSETDFAFRSASDAKRTEKVKRHLTRAKEHHGELAEHHETMGNDLEEVRTTHRALSATLAELGIGRNKEVRAALEACDRSIRAFGKGHVDATDSAESAKDSLDQGLEALGGDDEFH